MVQLIQIEDPANSRKKLWFFRVHSYYWYGKEGRKWTTFDEAVEIPKEWFKAHKNRAAIK